MANKNRTKGHNLERDTANDFKDIFPKVKTARNASNLLDSCKIDIAFLPINIQCKSGYPSNRPKWDILKKECETLLIENYPKNDPIHKNEFILRHKLGRNDMATLNWDFFLHIYKFYVKNNLEEFNNFI